VRSDDGDAEPVQVELILILAITSGRAIIAGESIGFVWRHRRRKLRRERDELRRLRRSNRPLARCGSVRCPELAPAITSLAAAHAVEARSQFRPSTSPSTAGT
jgi:hypothetical protein